MLKYFIVLTALIAVALAQSDRSLRTKCTYFRNSFQLNCKGPLGRVECLATENIPARFNIIGLGFDDQDHVAPPASRFRLFPLKEDHTGWLNHTFTMNGAPVSLSIFQSDLITDSGLIVRDADCFEKLSNLFRASRSNLIVPLNNAAPNQSFKRLSLFGEIFFFDKVLNAPVVNTTSNVVV